MTNFVDFSKNNDRINKTYGNLSGDKMFIGNLEIKGKVALAPMAGVADRAMREICIRNGAAFAVGELCSAKGITMGDKKSEEYLKISDLERPMASQLFGDDPQVMAKAAVKALEYKPDFIDINMGCPAPKVAKSGGGSALLDNLPLAGEIVKAVVNAVDVPVTAKIRIGRDDDHIVAVELAKIIEDAGASMITVHGRTRAQQYAPSVRLEPIADVKRAVSIPVVGNGDVVDGKSAENMIKVTGCDMVMVGRAAMGAPWIFSQINAYLEDGTILPDPTVEEKMNYLLEQGKLVCEYKPEKIAMLQMRKHASWYIKGYKGAAKLREKCANLVSLDGLKELVDEVLHQSTME